MPVLADGSPDAHQCKQQEKQAGDLQPENVRYPANVAGRDSACVVESPDDAILTGPGAGDSQECAAVPAEITRWQEASFPFFATRVAGFDDAPRALFYQPLTSVDLGAEGVATTKLPCFLLHPN